MFCKTILADSLSLPNENHEIMRERESDPLVYNRLKGELSPAYDYYLRAYSHQLNQARKKRGIRFGIKSRREVPRVATVTMDDSQEAKKYK